MLSLSLVLFMNVLFYIRNAEGTCGVCGTTSGVMCLSSKTFRPCFDGTVSGNVTTCPNGTVCSDSSEICGNWTTTPDCAAAPSVCGVCSSDRRFACLNATTFAYCFGSTTSSSITGTCLTDTYCDILATTPSFCSTNSSATCIQKPTYPWYPTKPTYPSNWTAGEYCRQIGARGGQRYSAPNPSNCKQFAYCFRLNGMLQGNYYLCSGSTIFNNSTGMCVPSTQYTCPESYAT